MVAARGLTSLLHAISGITSSIESSVGGGSAVRVQNQQRQGSVVASSVTSSSALATSTAPTCPKSNNTVFIASSGATFLIECYVDHSGGDLKMVNVASNKIADCIAQCDSTAGCIDISMSGTACYMKKSLGASLTDTGVRGARLISAAPSSTSSISVSSTPSSTSTSSTFSSVISSSSSAVSSSASSSSASSSSVASSSASSSVASSTSSSSSASSVSSSSAASSSAASSSSSAASQATAAADGTCDSLIAALSFPDQDVTVTSCEDVNAGGSISLASGPSNCAASVVPEIGIRRLTLDVVTSSSSSNYVEVWLPSASNWNGRFMTTDNKGLSGCASYDDMTYTSSLGFAVVGDNGGHNSSEYLGFDATQFLNNNELVVDWSYRARHAAVVAGKQVIKTYYGEAQSYSYMLGCSNGGRQALQSAQMFPDDFDGIISGSSLNDFNHHIDWSGRMYVLTGADSSDDKYLSYDDWVIVHNEVLAQCDEALDGVADGILEDSTICDFNATKLTCVGDATENCLTFTQTSTVWNIFSQLYDADGNLLYPRLAPGSELYSSTNGVLHGVQGHVEDWFRGAVWNDSSWDPTTLSATDYDENDALNVLHGNVSSYNGDLSAFRDAGAKLIMFHGLMDPAVSAEASQRYYLHTATTMGLDNTELDDFMRFFRISGMYHCTGGIGAWAFGQNINARAASDNVITEIMNWVENGTAPDTMTGTKWVNDDPSNDVEIERAHCRFPYRNTYDGSGNPNVTSSWSCQYISDWQDCGVYVVPRLC